jgi:hypothetical protein
MTFPLDVMAWPGLGPDPPILAADANQTTHRPAAILVARNFSRLCQSARQIRAGGSLLRHIRPASSLPMSVISTSRSWQVPREPLDTWRPNRRDSMPRLAEPGGARDRAGGRCGPQPRRWGEQVARPHPEGSRLTTYHVGFSCKIAARPGGDDPMRPFSRARGIVVCRRFAIPFARLRAYLPEPSAPRSGAHAVWAGRLFGRTRPRQRGERWARPYLRGNALVEIPFRPPAAHCRDR